MIKRRFVAHALWLFVSRGAAWVLIALLVPGVARAQRGDLAGKLDDLNVRLQTEHYAIAGSVTQTRLEMYGNALEYIYREYSRGFGQLLDDTKESQGGSDDGAYENGEQTAADADARVSMSEIDKDHGLHRVIVFARRQEYHDFGAAFLGSSEHTIGKYIPSLELLLILDQGNFEDTYEVLFHEAFHQFLRRHVKNPPVWLNEGLAVHYGYAKPTRGGLSFSQPKTDYWKMVRKLMETKKAIPLWDVVSASRSKFYSKAPVKVSGFKNVTRSNLYYGEAYTLVHTLMNDRSATERLQNYVRDLAKADGKNTMAITKKYFGPKVCDHLVPFWIKHVRSRPDNQ